MDRGFLLLAIAIAVLSAVSFAFAVIALLLRFFNDRSSQRLDELTEQWEPALLEVLAGSAGPDSVLSRVSERDTDDFLAFLLGYARRLRGEEQQVVREMAAPYLPGLVTVVERGGAEERGLAVQVLARMGMPEYADTVAKALDDESPVVAMLAARGLFRRGQEQYFSQVLQRMHRFKLWSRSYLASMLAGGGPSMSPLLRKMFGDREEDPLVRAVASDALRSLNDLHAVDVAVQLLQEEDDRELMTSSLRVVRQLGHREHVEIVMPFVTASDPVVRAAAVGAVGALGAEDDVPILQSLLDDEAYWVSLEAARGLMALGEADILRRLAAGGGPWSLLARQVLTE